MKMSQRRKPKNSPEDSELAKDARDLHKAVSELVRVYQFRDRKCIYYYDVSVTQCYTLGALLKLGPVTLNQLAAELYLDKSTASRVADSLEKKGYIHRSPDPDDARAIRLEATKEGRDLHSRIVQDLVDETKTLIQDLGPDVRQATARVVARLAEAASVRFSGKRKAADELETE
jgi:DNA-binding MarR family transcriptional regulator